MPSSPHTLERQCAPLRVVLPVSMPKPPRDLQARAAVLWPDDARLQAEWVRAVRVVRSTARGWLLDESVQRKVEA